MGDTVLLSEQDKVLTITINRPERRNALDFATYNALTGAFKAATGRNDLHAIILQGAQQYFTAGNDLRDFQQKPEDESPGLRFLKALAATDIPVIAAVEGAAIGIGVTLLMHCDFVIAASNTTFRIPFVPLGLCPEGSSSVLLAKYVGIRKANEWLYSGKPFSANEALDCGFINTVTEPGESLATAMEIANNMAKQSLLSLKTTKSLLKRTLTPLITETFNIEREAFIACLNSPEAQAAFKQFFTKEKSIS
ncbi:MAG: enoyl-CoA hydratase [Alcaligenaceae bacterium]|nr:enoyl-CoA hydratase [Alcaligenaceae bacterium]